jgi:NADH-quinone oxidoreductase subunit J
MPVFKKYILSTSLTTLLLYFILTLTSLFVIFARNSFYSIVSLIISFVTASCILFILECEFFALIFLVVYVGAIAVLFLFIVMMLDLKNLSMTNKINMKYFIFGIFVMLCFLFLVKKIMDYHYEFNPYDDGVLNSNFHKNFYNEDVMPEILVIGQVLYTSYSLQFLTAGLILSLTLFGVIQLAPKSNSKTLRGFL